MEQLGVISRIKQLTEWCSGMVVAPKKCKDEIRICVDLSPSTKRCAEKSLSSHRGPDARHVVWAPLKSGESDGDNLIEETHIYVDSIIANLPASESYLTELRKQLSADSMCA